MRRLLWSALALGLCVASFYAGSLRSELRQSLHAEAAYPHDLEKQLNAFPVDCETFRKGARTGSFVVDALPGGSQLRVLSYDPLRKTLTASVLDTQHRHAVASWEVSCEEPAP